MNEVSLRSLLTSRLASRLRIDSAEIDPRESFTRYGLTSAGATAFVAELSAELGRPLSPTLVWAHPNVEELARHLAGGTTATTAARPAPPPTSAPSQEPIAIVGIACRFPLSPDPRAFWRLFRNGVDATRFVPPDRWDADALYDPDPQAPGTINTRRGAFLDRVDLFDPMFFGISPREAAEMDPQQRLALELAWEGLEDAGIPPRSLAGTRTGVFVGVIFRDYADVHRAADAPVTSHTGPGTSLSIVANRISYALGLRGPSLSVDTACSASLVSVHLACQSLRDGECSLALAGGVNVILYPGVAVELTKFGGLSGDGRCKAFDASADGFARGEGGGMVVLKPLSRALADGDPIYALIRGGAVNNDGFSNGLTAPNPQAQVEVLTDAYARAGVDPRRVQYVETHGTGTPLGDPIEARALAAVLCAGRDPSRPLVIGSAKTNIAHQEGAAGIAGLIKLALAIHHRQIPPSLHFQTPNPDIPFEELGLRVQTELGPWPLPEGEPILAGVSSFGWGGTNAHLVLEGFHTPDSDSAPEERHSSSLGFQPQAAPVFVFAGMGSQWPGMARDLLRSEPLVRARLERCDRALRPQVGWSLLDELIGGDRWGDIEVALPCLAALGIALADLWRSWGIAPGAVTGHSSGEIAAAYAAGVLTLEESMLVAVHYSRALGKIQGPGGMGVVGLPPEETAQRIAAEGRDLTVAGWLSPASAAVAGNAVDVDAFLVGLAPSGVFAARVALLDVAAHTAQVLPHLPALREALVGLEPRPAAVPLFSTVSGEVLDRPMDADYWAGNVSRPVLFSQAVQRLLALGNGMFLEIDAHPILTTPLEQGFAAADVPGRVLPSLRRGEKASEILSGSLAVLEGAGLRVGEERPRAELVPISARSPEALRDLARETAATVEAGDEPVRLRDLAWTAALRRSHHEHRLAVVARTRDELAERLKAFARGEAVAGAAVGRRARGEAGGLTFVFSGQGPQWPGMGRQLFDTEPVFRRVVARCDETLRPLLGYSFRERMESEDDALTHTEVAQPAIYALQAGLAALWREWGVIPGSVVGHSVGEVAAAHVAGALTLEEGAIVAACRGRAMEPARGLGRMAAVELPAGEVETLLADLGGRVAVAAVNSPAATTVAGDPEALDELVRRLDALGVTCRRLRVEYAFHTAQMDPCVRELRPLLAELRPRAVTIPMISTVTAGPVAGPDLDAGYWCANVREPVRFAPALQALAGGSAYLEIGPHPVLSVAVSQTLEAVVLASLRRGRDERETLLETLGSLWVLGQPVDWLGVHPDGGRQVRLPTYPFQRQRYWFEAREKPKTPVLPAPSPPPAVLAPDPPPVGVAEDLFVEGLLAEQLDAFNRMVAQQLDLLGRSN